MAGQDDNREDNNDGDDNTIVHSDENQNTIQNDNNSDETSVWVFVYLNRRQQTTPRLRESNETE